MAKYRQRVLISLKTQEGPVYHWVQANTHNDLNDQIVKAYIKSNSKFDLAFAKKYLESPAFYNFVKSHGTPTTKTSYRISVKEIENYQFDPADL